MGGFVVWLTGDRSRMDAIAEALRIGLAGTAKSVDVFTAEMVEDKLCSVEPRGPDFRELVLRRLGWLCHVLQRNDSAAVAVAGSPKRATRDEARKIAGGHLLEVVVRGAMPEGWEAPHYPEVDLAPTDGPDVSVKRVREALLAAGLVPETGNVYSAEEEARIKERLEKLGYL
jgi:hypothetical protein